MHLLQVCAPVNDHDDDEKDGQTDDDSNEAIDFPITDSISTLQ